MEPISPRASGMLAAQHLGKTITDNPMDTATLPDGTPATAPTHPHRQWTCGFMAARMLMHKQTRRAICLGYGIVHAFQIAPQETTSTLVGLGRKSGEFLALALLAAMMEAEESTVPVDNPEAIQAVYAAMKLRMTGKPPCCRHEPSAEIHARAHNLAGALMIVFNRPANNQVTLNVDAMTHLLEGLAKLDAELRDDLMAGKLDPITSMEAREKQS